MTAPLDIVICGGGTAGWMTAAALTGMLPETMRNVRLIESDEIGTVGVGEATLPQMKDFNDAVGIIEPDMMRRTQATFKLGIEFIDWGLKGSSYIHPFGVLGQPVSGAEFLHHWTRARLAGHATDIEDYSFAIQACRANRFDFPIDDKAAVASTYAYAYHLDASLYAAYLRKFSEARGLRRQEGRIVSVQKNGESGAIVSVTLESGEVVAGDLFIDCTGFRGLLIGDEMQSPFEDWTKWLPCDRAVAMPCESAGPLRPYTRSTALEAGWQWQIPLQHRMGNGYVYSSGFLSDDGAAARLVSRLEGAPLGDPRFLKFRAGRRTCSWTENCVAIGLSSGFLEPLESTSIYLIQTAVLSLLKLLPGKRIDPALRTEFNRLVDIEYDRVRDFLILHYHLNSRDDSELWRYCRNMSVPDSLTEKIEAFRHRGHVEIYRHGLFAPPSWISVMVGQGLSPEGYDRLVDNVPMERTLSAMAAQRSAIAESVGRLPAHDAFVRDYCPARSPERQSAPAGT